MKSHLAKERLHFRGLAAKLLPELVEQPTRDLDQTAMAKRLAGVGDTVIVAAWIDEFDLVIAAQADARAQGAAVIGIGIDLKEATIFGLSRSSTTGCAECWARWTSASGASANRPHRRSDIAPWPEMFRCEIVATVVCMIGAPLAIPAGVRVMRSDFQQWSRYGVAQHPSCEACAPVIRLEPDAYADLLDDTPMITGSGLREKSLISLEPDLGRAFVSKRFSLIRNITHDTRSHLFPMAFALMPLDEDISQSEVGVGRTGRLGLDRSVAIVEAVERFCGFRPRHGQPQIRAKRAELDEFALDPRTLILHADEQRFESGFSLLPYDDALEVDWVWGFSVRNARPILVPAQVAYYRLPVSRTRPVNRFVYEISNGCSVGASLTEAALHGLGEVIERDAYLCAWYGHQTPNCVDPKSLTSNRARALIARIEGAGYQVRLLDLRAGIGLPAIGAFLLSEDPTAPSTIVTAAAAHADAQSAVESALIETATNIIDLGTAENARRRARGKILLENPERVTSSADHIDQCRPFEALERLDFLITKRTPVHIADLFPARRGDRRCDIRATWTALCADVLRIASDIIVVDQTSPALAAVGLHCVKVIAPGLLPMTFGHQYRRISDARLAHLPTQRIIPAGHDAVLPHPFP